MINIKNKSIYKNTVLIVLGAGFFIADRIFKSLAISGTLPDFHIGKWLIFEFTGNRFISFSLPMQGFWLEMIIVLLTAILISASIFIGKKNQSLAVLLSIIAAGSISNLVDRFSFGYVIDYIYIKNLFVFNLADAMITIPAISWTISTFIKK
jgi:signal peptidase II